MREAVLGRLRKFFDSWEDLASTLPETALTSRLPAASNTIGSQFWCLVGARESYTAAIAAGAWAGFRCSLSGEDISSRDAVLAGMRSSAAGFAAVLPELDWNTDRDALLLALLEHEAQHQGQMIRYVYALGYEFPPSWKARWSLE
jgi:hypothetical protein